MVTATGRKTTSLNLDKGKSPLPRATLGELPLLEHLAVAPQDMTLGQALRLLGMAHSEVFEVWLRFMQRRVRVRSWLSLAFPSTELAEYRYNEQEETVELTATSFGLYGTLGALPTFYTEELLEEARSDESASRDFLDIINSHLHHCLYWVSLWGKLARRTAELRNPQAVHVLHCLMGQAYPPLRPEGPPQTAVLGLLLRHTRSAMGLEDYCAYSLGFAGTERAVRTEQCVPRMARILESQRCRLGQANSTLGTDMYLGQQVSDCTGKFRLHFEGMSRQDMEFFLPKGQKFAAVGACVRQYLDVPLEYDVVLHPAPGTVFRQRLGACLGGYLLPDDSVSGNPVTVYHSV